MCVCLFEVAGQKVTWSVCRMTERSTETDTVYISVYFTHIIILRLSFIASKCLAYDDDCGSDSLMCLF